MFITIDLRVIEQSKDGRTVKLEADRPVTSFVAYGKIASEASGTIELTLPLGLRLQSGDLITGQVRYN